MSAIALSHRAAATNGAKSDILILCSSFDFVGNGVMKERGVQGVSGELTLFLGKLARKHKTSPRIFAVLVHLLSQKHDVELSTCEKNVGYVFWELSCFLAFLLSCFLAFSHSHLNLMRTNRNIPNTSTIPSEEFNPQSRTYFQFVSHGSAVSSFILKLVICYQCPVT